MCVGPVDWQALTSFCHQRQLLQTQPIHFLPREIENHRKKVFYTSQKIKNSFSWQDLSMQNNIHAGKIRFVLLRSKHLAFLQLIFLKDSSTSINIAKGAFFANFKIPNQTLSKWKASRNCFPVIISFTYLVPIAQNLYIQIVFLVRYILINNYCKDS